jgi:predicted negative regulator of RcsB-dependent stress response
MKRISMMMVVAAMMVVAGAVPARAQQQRVPNLGEAAWGEMAAFIGLVHTYIELVEGMSRIASDPSQSAIAALLSARDILEQQSPQAAIEYFNKLLTEMKDPAVQRVVRMQLAELYRKAHQPERAMEHLRALILQQ